MASKKCGRFGAQEEESSGSEEKKASNLITKTWSNLEQTNNEKLQTKRLSAGEGNRGQKGKIKTIKSRREEQIYMLKEYNWDIRKYYESK